MTEKSLQTTLNESISALEQERQFLEVLCRDYTSVYYADLLNDVFEPLKIDSVANAAKFLPKGSRIQSKYDAAVKFYSENYVIKEQADRFRQLLSRENLTNELSDKERLIFRYKSVPNLSGQQFFEAQIVRISTSVFDGKLLVGFRHIDDIIAMEQQKQMELEAALTEARMKNEVISAIGKIYYAIFMIDLENDYFELISSDKKIKNKNEIQGTASIRMVEICNEFVVSEYHDRVLEFFDVSTLAERLRNDDTIATEYIAKDGNWHTARFIVKRRNDMGEATNVLYVTRLISDAKRREKNWIAMAEDANKANAAKTEFISQIAHDIRTPMNAILGFAAIAENNLDNPEKIKYSLEKIKSSGLFLMDLVNEVLDISSIENGQLKLTPKAVNIFEFLNEFPPLLEQIRYNKDLTINCHFHDFIYTELIIDPLRLRQIYSNILSNAIKYTPDGGTVDFDVYEEIIPDSNKVSLIAVIKDNGIGMSQDFIDNMYSKFSRATDSRINTVNGYGLGLSIVKELVDLMNGSIDVESELGKGSKFKVTLSVPYDILSNESSSNISKDDYGSICNGMHLLVAEDNPINFEVVSELLGLYNITCEQAYDGAICVEMFKTAAPHTYDAILMDMQMPVMDGLQAASAIRKLNTADAHSIPIISMTANAFKEDIKKCMDAGMNDYMSKPIDINKLLGILAKYRRI